MNEDRMQIGDAELRMALRGLRQDVEPGHDLWPGIAARLQVQAGHASPAIGSSRHGWLWPLASAASVLLAVGIAWHFNPVKLAAATVPVSAIAQASRPAHPESRANRVTLVQREADGMTAHYQAALRELAPHTVPAGWQPGIDTFFDHAEVDDGLAGLAAQVLFQDLEAQVIAFG